MSIKQLERLHNIFDKTFHFVMFLFFLYLCSVIVWLIYNFPSHNGKKIDQILSPFFVSFFSFLGLLLIISFIDLVVVEKIKKKYNKNSWLN